MGDRPRTRGIRHGNDRRSGELGAGTNISAMIRIHKSIAHLIPVMLGRGSIGIQVSEVENAEAARAVVRLGKYPPIRHRGVSSQGRIRHEPAAVPPAPSADGDHDFYAEARWAALILRSCTGCGGSCGVGETDNARRVSDPGQRRGRTGLAQRPDVASSGYRSCRVPPWNWQDGTIRGTKPDRGQQKRGRRVKYGEVLDVD